MATHIAQKWLRSELPKLADAITVSQLADAVLVVECRDSITQQECRHLFPALTAYLARECPEAFVREIRIIRTK